MFIYAFILFFPFFLFFFFLIGVAARLLALQKERGHAEGSGGTAPHSQPELQPLLAAAPALLHGAHRLDPGLAVTCTELGNPACGFGDLTQGFGQ